MRTGSRSTPRARGLDHEGVNALERLIRANQDIRITEPIAMELLAGLVRPGGERVTQLVNGLPQVPLEAAIDFRAAADLAVASARNGHRIRSLVDCLIAAVAIRRDIPLLHRDRDFDFITEISPLRAFPVAAS